MAAEQQTRLEQIRGECEERLADLLAGREDQRLWPEDVAHVLGDRRATVKQLLWYARRDAREGRSYPLSLPLPVEDEVRRQVHRADGRTLTVVSPWWSADQIRDYLARRADPELRAAVWPRGSGGRFSARGSA